VTIIAEKTEPLEELIRLAQGGVESEASDARLQLIVQHQPLINAMVRRAGARAGQRQNAEQAGIVGFLEALARFDPDRGTPLVAFAKPFVKGAVLAVVYDTAERVPTFDLSDLTDDDEPGIEDAALTFADLTDAVGALRQFVAGLAATHQHLVKRIFVDDATQAEVARELGVSRAAVNQMLAGIYRRGREELRPFASAVAA
jgi:RNA polymerase sigma factor (sigma-70 family)